MCRVRRSWVFGLRVAESELYGRATASSSASEAMMRTASARLCPPGTGRASGACRTDGDYSVLTGPSNIQTKVARRDGQGSAVRDRPMATRWWPTCVPESAPGDRAYLSSCSFGVPVYLQATHHKPGSLGYTSVMFTGTCLFFVRHSIRRDGGICDLSRGEQCEGVPGTGPSC